MTDNAVPTPEPALAPVAASLPVPSPAPSPAQTAKPAGPPMAHDPDDPSHVLLRMPVHVRSATLALLAALLVIAMLRWASDFFIPVMIGFMMSYALTPLVDMMQRWRIPRAVSAAVLLIGILGGTGASIYSFSDDASQLVSSLPTAASKLRDAMRSRSGTNTASLDTVQKAAAQLERAAAETGPTPVTRGVQRVQIEKPHFNIRDYLWTGTMGLVSFLGQVVIVVFLTYFLLLSGDTFRRKLVKITGPSLTNKRITVQALDEITLQIQRYLIVQLLLSVVVGIATGLAFWALGMNQSVVWGLASGLLNFVPYIGAIIVTGAAALIAFMQFGEVNSALYVAGASLVIHTIVGNLIVPWLTSKASRMNPVAVFIGVLGWGWLWGVWGLLLGIPIMMIVKAVCDRVDDLKPIGELLGT
ncbi:AI-2E family transporter [Caenimonas koreensis]|uniref:AI-2E family transporter n=1 Tax=Caenimonas koreensis DSM 17982 TaxID=1121255 RepID=A0A844B375_9BURK|nr:AI-2E family transporter [Caenimonas koreensis]MRD47673.1 AI-2E family transporter [Caenimonas koreensis DSM 17982]